MQHNLVAENIIKRVGKRELLRNVNLELAGGSIYGFTGENGSGKTMLFRVLCGLVRPSRGHVWMDGEHVHRGARKARVGVLLENPALWPELTGRENLLYLSRIQDVIPVSKVEETMVRVGLDPGNSLPFRKYSLGMRQRLLIAQAVMEEPDFLFLDEPTNSLDEEGVDLIRQIIAGEAERGAVVLLSSHLKQDISWLCDQVYFMENGMCRLRRHDEV